MIRKKALRLVGLFWVSLVTQVVFAQKVDESGHEKHVRILTVGNSFTQNATRYLAALVEAAGHRLTHQMLSIGGSPLELHAGKALAFELSPGDANAKYSNGKSLQEVLLMQPWDFVTIQQASIKSHDISTYRPYAEQLAEIIHRHALQAQLLVHQTWAYRQDDKRFTDLDPKAGEPVNQQAMYDGICQAYSTTTAELNARRIPVGDAFWLADHHEKFGFQLPTPFNPQELEYPQLPDQQYSLHVGYRWGQREGARELQMDGHHASLAGQYLGACVWFECLYGESVIGNGYIPNSLDPEYATFLQQVAHQAVQKGTDVASGVVHDSDNSFSDPIPQRYLLHVRASSIDSRAREYPDISFEFGTPERPSDLEYAAVDTRVALKANWQFGSWGTIVDYLNA